MGAPPPAVGAIALLTRNATVFCEDCGRGYELAYGKRIAHVLEPCTSCGIYICATCRSSTTGQCAECAAAERAVAFAATNHDASLSPHVQRPAALTIGASLAGVVVIALVALNARSLGLGTPAESPDGHVAGASGVGRRPAAAASPSVKVTPAATAALPAPSVASIPSRRESGASTPPPGQPRVAVDAAFTRARAMGPTTRVAIMAVLRNDGPSSVTFPPSSTRFALGAQDGNAVLADGTFTYLIPASVGPGERAYAIEVMPALFAGPATLGRVTVMPVATLAERPMARLKTSDLTWSTSTDGQLRASGTVLDDSAARVDSPFVAVIFLDADDRPLAILYELGDGGLDPGQSATFDTDYPASVAVDPKAVVRVEAIAYDLAATEGSG